MIRLHFESVIPEHAVILGPAPYFRISGQVIRRGPGNEIVRRYRNHFWEIQGDMFSRCDCRDNASIHFEDAFGGASEFFGPFRPLFMSDGTVYADHEPFAKFVEEARCWHHCATNVRWPVLVVR